jgi:flagellar motility protein MotE (MotC chaperone)
MKMDQRGVSTAALLLLILLLIAIIGVTTLLVGRALGWWTYSDLPLVGRFFPAEETQEPPAEAPDPLATLQAELDNKNQTISELQARIQQQEQELSELTSQVSDLTAELQAQTASQLNQEWKATAKMLESMRAEQAVAIISRYSESDISTVLHLMSAEAAGGILGKMDPALAARVTAASK